MNDDSVKESGITVGQLIKQLQRQNPNDPISFGSRGHLTFYRVKDRGGVTQIEFNQDEGPPYE